MKPFNLEEYLVNPSRKVVTRDGRSTRIICTDAKGKHPIIALIDGKDGSEVIYSFRGDGRAVKGTHSQDDLFFAIEKHEGWVNVYKNAYGSYVLGEIFIGKEPKEVSTGLTYIATAKIEWED